MLWINNDKFNFLVIYIYLSHYFLLEKQSKLNRSDDSDCLFFWPWFNSGKNFSMQRKGGHSHLKIKQSLYTINLDLQLLTRSKKGSNSSSSRQFFSKKGFKRWKLSTFDFIKQNYYTLGQKKVMTFRRKSFHYSLSRLKKEIGPRQQGVRLTEILNIKTLFTGGKVLLQREILGAEIGRKKYLRVIGDGRRRRDYLEKRNSFKQKKFKAWKFYKSRPSDLKYWSLSSSKGRRLRSKRRFVYRFILNTNFLKEKLPFIGRFTFLNLVVRKKFYFMLRRGVNNYFFTVVDQVGNVKISVSAGNLGIVTKKKKRPLYVTRSLIELVCQKLYQLGVNNIECVLLFFFNRKLIYDIFYILKRFGVGIRKIKLVNSRPHGKLPRAKKLRRL